MKRKTVFFFLMATCCYPVYAAPVLSAEEVATAANLAKTSGCMTCHSVSEKIVGPAYSKVAAKYEGDSTAASSLAQSIRNGSSGKWGRIPMPPHSSISAEDIDLLSRWVLTLK